ncbi:hypothetical protein MED121_15689 [Marinomonas sp. MED121]|uniref:late competence development ComFB family protein n=1 Tax=Marinomonas sp. MED121 TaxID=314277 RepID=UPI00006910C1|nr:late competence development ComFB family protein [Marinomonas sp. MED121]EAQ67383.1 hypothetical protein MED121_15689 [Marinomonas sp. MED121]
MRLDNSIHNYYEHLVLDYINLHFEEDLSDNYISDLICLTLNKLPPKYIRHEVDMAFYLPQVERLEMEGKVDKAIQEAQLFLKDAYPSKS